MAIISARLVRRRGTGVLLLILVLVLLGCTLLLTSVVTFWKFVPESQKLWELQHPGLRRRDDSSAWSSLGRVAAILQESNGFPVGRMRPTHHACDNYDGVLHIESGDAGAAAGTLFFQYMVNQLIYADMHHLKPFIHLNNVSQHAYDPIVHGGGNKSSGTGWGDADQSRTIENIEWERNLDELDASSVSFSMLYGMTIEWTSDGYQEMGFGSYPGRPVVMLEHQNLTPRIYQLYGTGVWNHYFFPVSDFVPGDVSCLNKPLIKMHYYHLNPSLLFYTPWSVKSWPYTYIPTRLLPQTTLMEWYRPMRQRGHEIVQKYFNFQPRMVELANQANPPIVQTTTAPIHGNNASSWSNYQYCLAMHVRHSDKGGSNRKRIAVESFLPYAEAYQKAGGQRIFVATDSGQVLTTIHDTWPPRVRALVRSQGDDNPIHHAATGGSKSSGGTSTTTITTTATTTITTTTNVTSSTLRSDSKMPVFKLYGHHRTNTEVLVDILAMSKCSFFIHGFSAVSEATIYLNFPQLHDYSIDLENHPLNNEERKSPLEFETLVRNLMKEKLH
jgi:hypothetical protein